MNIRQVRAAEQLLLGTQPLLLAVRDLEMKYFIATLPTS